jgi:hypothetical protein
LVNPVKEEENEDSLTGLTNDDEIIAQVHLEQALECEEVEEVESDDDEVDTEDVKATEMLEISKKLEDACLKTGIENALEMLRILCRFQAELMQMRTEKAKQVTIH